MTQEAASRANVVRGTQGPSRILLSAERVHAFAGEKGSRAGNAHETQAGSSPPIVAGGDNHRELYWWQRTCWHMNRLFSNSRGLYKIESARMPGRYNEVSERPTT